MMPEQQQRILGYFIEEAKDHLNTIEQGLLNLQATIQDSEMVNEVFRAAHSVKGGAAMLSLGSIQLTSHRLEDYFKVLKEAPTTQVDRDLESMFLQVFDGLQALLEELQGPFGLTEDKAQEVMADIEPVFDRLESHLNALVAKAPAVEVAPKATAPATTSPLPTMAATARSEDSALKLVFSSDVPGHLREMLTLFKQADNETSRSALQASCEALTRIGEQFDLNAWCILTSATYRAVGNPEQTYRALAPVVIKELKRAQEQVLAGQATAIAISAELEALVPLLEEADGSLGDIDSLLDDVLSDTEEPDLADLFNMDTQVVAEPEEDLDWLDLSAPEAESATASSSNDDFDESFDVLSGGIGSASYDEAVQPEPIVGAAELNSLADLFEGEVAGLDSPWEEMSNNETTNVQNVGPDFDLPDEFSDLLEDSLASEETVDTEQDLVDLFGDTTALEDDFSDILSVTGADESSADDSDPLQDFDDLFDTTDSNLEESSLSDADSEIALDNLLNSVTGDEEVVLEEPSNEDALDLDYGSFAQDEAESSADFASVLGEHDDAIAEPETAPEAVAAPLNTADIDISDPSFEAIADPWSTTESLEAEDSDDSALDALDELWSESHTADDSTAIQSDDLDEVADLGFDDFPSMDNPLDVSVPAADIELTALIDSDDSPESDLGELFDNELDSDLSDFGDLSASSDLDVTLSQGLDPLGSNTSEFPESEVDFGALFDDDSSSTETDSETELQDLFTTEYSETPETDIVNFGFEESGEESIAASSDDSVLAQDLAFEMALESTADASEPIDLAIPSEVEDGNLDELLGADEVVAEEDISEDAPQDLDFSFASSDSDNLPLNITEIELDALSDDGVFSETTEESLDELDFLADGEAIATDSRDSSSDDDFFGGLSIEESSTEMDRAEFDLEDELQPTPEANETATIGNPSTAEDDIDGFFETPMAAATPSITEELDGAEELDNFSDIGSHEFDPDSALQNESSSEIDDGLLNEELDDFDQLASEDFETEEDAAFLASTRAEELTDPGLLESSDSLDDDLFDNQQGDAELDFDLGDPDSLDADLLGGEQDDSELDFDLGDIDTDEVDTTSHETAGADDSFGTLDIADEDPEFDDLDDLLGDDTALEGAVTSGASGTPNFDDLDSLLSDGPDLDAEESTETVVTGNVDFGELDALLGDGIDSDTAHEEPYPTNTRDEFSDLEKLLEEADQTLGGSSASMRPTASGRAPRRVGGIVDQTMRVSVKHLDNLNNLVGELVVNRNSLEQDQDRLRQFLDNLLFQVQQLNDVGQRMRDLYERSLLESSLLASRQAFQSGGLTRLADSPSNGGSHATGATFDALEMDRFTGFHTLTQEMVELIVRVRESASDIAYTVESTDQIARQFRQVTTQLQEGLNKARMVPFAQTADRLPRAVRDISIKCGKEARLIVEGRDTLIDKMILERLYDPMTHLVNNAITHGIESPDERAAIGKPREGTITVRAFYQGNQTVIYIADDGGGINPDIVKRKAIQKGMLTQAEADAMNTLETYELLFRHGFSTRDKADDFAGRGVGMDVVRTALSEIRGSITIDSDLGRGTSFTIRLPLTLSISKALSCLNNQARIAFPMDGVEDMFDVPKERIQTNESGHSCIQWRDTTLTFQPLSELLQFNRALGRGRVYGGSQDDDMISIVVLRNANTYIGIQVDRVLGEQEIVIKQIEGPVPKPMGIAGATVLGDGRVMPIGDVLELIDIAQGRVRREAGSSLWSQVELPPEEQQPETKSEPTVLIVDDSITVRELLSMSFNKVGYRVEQARDGQEAWEKMRSGLPCDLVFCDIEMPRMDGLELLSRMQKDSALKNIPIAMLTSRGADRHRQMAIDLGASGYFTKPYLEEALLDAAQRMLTGEVLLTKVEEEAEE